MVNSTEPRLDINNIEIRFDLTRNDIEHALNVHVYAAAKHQSNNIAADYWAFFSSARR